MQESGPGNIKKFVNWEQIRQTKEYKEYILGGIKDVLKAVLLPHVGKNFEDLAKAMDEADPDLSPEELIAELDTVAPLSDREHAMEQEINNLNALEEAEEYCNRVGLNPATIQQTLEQTYLRDQKLLQKYKEAHHTEPLPGEGEDEDNKLH